MKNVEVWRPSKFVLNGSRLDTSPDPLEVGVRSRIIVKRIAVAYQAAVVEHARGVLVDIGCGKVPLYGLYRQFATEIICIDWQNTDHPSPHLDHQVDLNQGIPLPKDSVDTVLATDVLEHLRDPVLFWHEVARVLRPGGKVIIGVPFLYWIHEAPYDYYRYTCFCLRGSCTDVGLKVLSLDPYGGPLCIILDVIGKNIPSLRMARGVQTLGNWLLSTRLGQRIDERHRESFPLGYCLVAQKS